MSGSLRCAAWGRWGRAALLACWVGSLVGPASAGGRFSAGIERFAFRDEHLDETYGGLVGPSVAGDLLRRPWVRLTARAAWLTGAHDPPAAAFVTTARTGVTLLPLRLQGRFTRDLAPWLGIWGGPEVAWAWFRETWEAHVPAARLAAERSEMAGWLGAGLAAGVRIPISRWGHLRAGGEQVWSDAERRSVPGNSRQVKEMTGGWWGLLLEWESPW